MANLLLSDEEKGRFIAYLEREAEDTEKLVEQMKKVNVAKPLIDMMSAEAKAYKIVALKMRAMESFDIGGK